MTQSNQAATMEEFKKTPYYQGLGIEGLEAQLEGYRQDEQAMKEQAEAQYRPAYENELEAARQELEKEVQGYRAQLEGNGAAYDRQRRNVNQAYEQSAAEMNNQLTKRGLGRSSLVSAQGAYLQNQLGQALAEIDRTQSEAIQAINEKIALLTEQAAQSERTMAENYARQLENRVGEMREKNREASISLQLQIAALQQQGYEAYQDWLLKNRQQEMAEREFEAEYGDRLNGGGAVSSSSSSSSKKQTAAKKETVKASGKSIGQTLGTFADAAKKLLENLTGGAKAAVTQQKTTQMKGASGSAAKLGAARAGQAGIRQNMKE